MEWLGGCPVLCNRECESGESELFAKLPPGCTPALLTQYNALKCMAQIPHIGITFPKALFAFEASSLDNKPTIPEKTEQIVLQMQNDTCVPEKNSFCGDASNEQSAVIQPFCWQP